MVEKEQDLFDQTLAKMPSCTLDADARRSQKERYRNLASSVIRVRRGIDVVLVDFDETVDSRTLQDVIAVERECCRWLRLDLDRVTRQLSVRTTDPDMRPALDAIRDAFVGAVR
jgi:hypothetical protein